MDKDIKTSLYIAYYQEIYDYIKKKVKTSEQAVEATKETFEEIFKLQDEEKESEEFLEYAKKIAESKCKNQRRKRVESWLLKIGGVLCVVGFVGMLCFISYLKYIDCDPSIVDDTEVNLCMQKIWRISQCESAYDLMDGGDALFTYYCTGIGDISLIKSGAMSWVEPDEKFYVAMIQTHNEEDVNQIISLMKEKVKPQEWFERYYNQVGTQEYQRSWNSVSIEDFDFYVNGEFILITYVDPELVKSGKRLSVKEMQKNFDKSVNGIKFKNKFNLI